MLNTQCPSIVVAKLKTVMKYYILQKKNSRVCVPSMRDETYITNIMFRRIGKQKWVTGKVVRN